MVAIDEPSLGFTQRGCRLKCKFCVVPTKEGKPRSINTIWDIWRGDPHPRKLHLLDNDFFGQDEDQWRARIAEIQDGGFKICLNQGINVRLISEEGAKALASVEYRDDQFQQRRISHPGQIDRCGTGPVPKHRQMGLWSSTVPMIVIAVS